MKEWRTNRSPEPSDALKRRVRIFGACFALVFFGLFVRLLILQVIQGANFKSLAENNRIAQRYVQSPRGIVFDSRGETLVDNRASFNVYILRETVKKLKPTVRMLAGLTEQPYRELYGKIRRASSSRPFLVKADIGRKIMDFLAERKPDYPGVYVQATPIRRYPSNEGGGHLLGYLGEVDDRQLKRLKKLNYRQGDLQIGRAHV